MSIVINEISIIYISLQFYLIRSHQSKFVKVIQVLICVIYLLKHRHLVWLIAGYILLYIYLAIGRSVSSSFIMNLFQSLSFALFNNLEIHF